MSIARLPVIAQPNAAVCHLREVAEWLREEGAEDLASDADRVAANVARRFQTNPHTPDRLDLPVAAWEAGVADMGLTVRKPSDHQIQFLQDGKVFADWWPSKGTTMMDGKRGPKCITGDAVVAWLKSA